MSKIPVILDLDTNRERGQAENLMVVNNSERTRIAREYANQFSQREQTSAFYVWEQKSVEALRFHRNIG